MPDGMNAACDSKRVHLALFTSSLTGGGVQRSLRNLAVALVAAGYRVDLVVCHDNAAVAAELEAAGVRRVALAPSPSGLGRALALRADPKAAKLLSRPVLLPLKSPNKVRYLRALTGYLERERPAALLAAMTQCNLVALWARRLTSGHTRVAVSERNMLSSFVAHHRHKWRWRYLPALVTHAYAEANAIIAVSTAVADDLAQTTGLARETIMTAPNPVVDSALRAAAAQKPDHPWFAAGAPPVVLGVGRLVAQKDPITLLRAFARLRAQRPARLVLIGDGPLRHRLTRLAGELGVAADVALLGWIETPFAYMADAAVTVLPSLWEGLPGVLIQAMACGCPVVATDCPGGSAEILAHGRYGKLVPMQDPAALAAAIAGMMDAPTPSELLAERAAAYSAERAAHRYAELMLGATVKVEKPRPQINANKRKWKAD
jgi:glycosyltransferase involved in cell wall biosynthesis